MDEEQRKEKVRADAERFLEALEKNLTSLVTLAVRVEEQATQYDVTAYEEFREELQNFRSLSILIQNRLDEISGEEKAEKLQDSFEQLQALMFSTFIKTCMKTFFVYSTKTVMSLGSKERFLKDLVFLQEAETRLRDEKLMKRLDESALDDLEIAKEILQEIIDNAPGIMSFGASQS